MAVPGQVWAPMFPIDPLDEGFSLDIQRAQELWEGEIYIYLSPEAKEAFIGKKSWVVGDRHVFKDGTQCQHLIPQCLIPSETANIIIIFHLDEDRRIYPGLIKAGEIIPKGFYRDWLNVTLKCIKLSASPSGTIRWPVVKDNSITFAKIPFNGVCQYCGNIIHGGHCDRKYCTEKESH
jgi:hypothetical protein